MRRLRLDLDARLLGKGSHRIGEFEVVALADVRDGISAGLACTEAMPEPCGGAYLERRGLLVVERAAAPILLTALLEHDGLGHEVNDVGRLSDALDVLIADHAPPPRYPT